MSWLFLLVTLIGAALAYNAFWPQYAPARRALLSFFAGWLTTELALHHIAWQAVATLGFIWAGALQHWPGKLALVITTLSWIALGYAYWRGREAGEVVERALRRELGADYATKIRPDLSQRLSPKVQWRRLLIPFPIRHPEVERLRDITYRRVAGLNLKLDVYRQHSRPDNCPTLLQIHGGGWVVGSKNEQALPLMYHLATRGWVCVSVDYRLSPHATFPEPVIDLKRAIEWVRQHGRAYGANPDFLVVTGGSAGGHLASLVALTANDPEYQPGFEEIDTSVSGCVSFYGVYDFTDRKGVWRHEGLRRLLEKQVMKAALDEAPERYVKASPISRITAEAPPFLVVHGDRDTMVPVEEARHFCEVFHQTARAPIVYAEIPGAQHAFELFPSLRSSHVLNGVERFLAYLYSQYLAGRHQEDGPGSTAAVG